MPVRNPVLKLWLVLISASLNLFDSAFCQEFKPVTAELSGIKFNNKYNVSDSIHTDSFLYLWNGGGVAIGDINGDGFQDIFFTGNTVGNRLYLNKGGLKFEDVTRKFDLPNKNVAWNTGVVMADVNSDGWLDIYVCRSQLDHRSGSNQLFINNQGKGFTEKANDYGLDIQDNCTQASFFDADGDGDLDVYIITYPKDGGQYSTYKKSYDKGQDYLLINENGTFKKDDKYNHLLNDFGFGLGLVTSDFDKNGSVDIFVGNDLFGVDRIYMNSSGQFADKTIEMFEHMSMNSMGADVGDINCDGFIDLLTLDMLQEDSKRRHHQMFVSSDYQRLIDNTSGVKQYIRNMLYLSCGGKYFREVGELSNIGSTDWSWSPLLFDADNDGDLDIFITNSLKKDFLNLDFSRFSTDSLTRMNKRDQKNIVYQALTENLPEFRLRNKLFINDNGKFIDTSMTIDNGKKVNTTGAAYGDLDNDGDLDIVLNNFDTTSFILENRHVAKSDSPNYLRIRLKPNGLNTYGLNTLVEVHDLLGIRLFEPVNAKGFQSSSEPIIHIGCRNGLQIDSLVLTWPDRTTSVHRNLLTNEFTTIAQPDLCNNQKVNPTNYLYESVEGKFRPAYYHKEDHLADFKIDPILHKKLSSTGPGFAIEDVNGDNFPDIYFCGAKGQSGALYLADGNEGYQLAPLQPWENYSNVEESSSLFADVDTDGDLDLIVCGSGYVPYMINADVTDRLYLNNGKGFFSEAKSFPKLRGSKSCISAADVDSDGDLDLFIGGRYSVDGYPVSPDSYLLINENGTFVDATDKLATGLNAVGMVSASLWTDFDNDNDKDLIVVGEWMEPVFFVNNDGKLDKLKSPIIGNSLAGFWNSIQGGDIDNDGDIDYVIGNFGENSILKANQTIPAKLYYPRLNFDTRPDPVLAFPVNGELSLFAKRDKMLSQVSSFRSRFIDYESYATVDILKLVGDSAPVVLATELKSAVLLNNGLEGFTALPLPAEAQSFPVYGIFVGDLDEDENLDLLLTGNCFSLSNELGNMDAGGIMAFSGMGNGHFKAVPMEQLGVRITDDAKAIGLLGAEAGKARWLISSNNGPARVISQSSSSSVSWLKITQGYICMKNGEKRKIENYYGNGFWTQSPNFISMPKEASLCR